MTDPSLPELFTPDLLNQLYREYEKSEVSGRAEWFRQRLDGLGLADHQKKLEEEFSAVVHSSYVFLDTYPGGAENSDQLWDENDAVIRRTAPWLNEENFNYAQYWSRYYAWHDGLVKS